MKTDIENLFRTVRDIPYRIPLTYDEVDCSCVGKNKTLMEELVRLDFEVRWRVCEFRWSDLPIPKHVLAACRNTEAEHAYLEVKIENTWQTVDATWDSGLSGVFEIAAWDGEGSSSVAVPVSSALSPEASASLMGGIGRVETEKDLQLNRDFYRAFNDWLESVRKNKK